VFAITAEEARAALLRCVAYTGTWQVDESRSTVIHQVALATLPSMVGRQERRYTLEGDLLTLEPPERILDGIPRSARLVWRRVRGAGGR
jgi:hypothetical protein